MKKKLLKILTVAVFIAALVVCAHCRGLYLDTNITCYGESRQMPVKSAFADTTISARSLLSDTPADEQEPVNITVYSAISTCGVFNNENNYLIYLCMSLFTLVAFGLSRGNIVDIRSIYRSINDSVISYIHKKDGEKPGTLFTV